MPIASAAIASENNRLTGSFRQAWLDWVAVILLGVVFRDLAPLPVLTACSAAVLLAVEVHDAVLRAFRRDPDHDVRPAFWERAMAAGSAFAGTAWGGYVFVVHAYAADQTEIALLLAIALLTGIWCLVNVASIKCMYAFALPSGGLTLAALLNEGDETDFMLSTILLVFLSAALWVLRRNSTLYRETAKDAAKLEAQVELADQFKELAEQDRGRLRSLLDAVPIPIIVSRPSDGLVLYRNEAAIVDIKQPGKTASSGAKTSDSFVDPSERGRLVSLMQRGESIANLEINLRKGDGTPFWALYSGAEMTYNGSPATIGVIVDITSRRDAEDALRESEEKFRLLTDHAQDVISMYNLEGTCLYNSPSVARVLGYTPEEMLNTKIQDYVHPDDSETVMLRNGTPTKVFRVRHKDGQWIWLEATVNLERDASTGEVSHISSVSRDVTERILYEQELKDARTHAEAADRAKSEFLAHMSHEIRTPLNAVIGFSEVMRDELFGPLGSPRYVEYMNDIHASGTHLLGLINDVLDLSKIEAGKFELLEDETRLSNIIDTACRIIHERAEHKNIDISVSVDADPDIWCDRRAITQILINLLGNSVKFTSEGGEISIETGFSAEGQLTLTVSDNGVGISAGDQQHVLEPFAQAGRAASLASDDTGTGLGLALSRSLAEKHGGTLRLESELGVGTRVIVSLPRQRVMDGMTGISRSQVG